MLELHSAEIESKAVQRHLERLLAHGRPGPRRAPAPAPAAPGPSGLRRLLRRWGWARRLHGGLNAWKLSGWSLRHLVLHTPIIGALAWRVWGRLTGRAFKLHVLGELGRVGHGNHELHLRLERLEEALAQARADEQQSRARLSGELALLEERQDRLLATVLRMDARAGRDSKPASPLFEPWYLALENGCRGSAESIGERLARYLPYVAIGPVADLGCGRGEWLKLLDARGIEALGVDNNAAMLGAAREAGLHVVHADMLAFLGSAAANSFGAITAFQVVEHLDQDDFLELFAQAMRVLKPGGLLLLETPNPENLQVAAYGFWQDPTHVRPLPPPLLAHTAAHFGFVEIVIERTNPWSEALQLEDRGEAARHLEKLLFCGQDYALIARKPHVDSVAD